MPHYSGAILALFAVFSQLNAGIVLRNGRVWTGDPKHPWAEAVAIEGDRIVEVGTNAEVSHRINSATQVIDLKGHLATPGFIDAHTHFLEGSLGLSRVNLFNAGSLEEMQRRLAGYAKSHPS